MNNDNIRNYEINPEELGLLRAEPDSLKGGTANDNAELLRAILSVKKVRNAISSC